MPKVEGTIKQRKAELIEKLTPEYMFERTSIFSDEIGEEPNDKRTVDLIKKNFRLWFDSWMREELKDLLK